MLVLRNHTTFLFLLPLIGCAQSEPATPASISQTTPTATVLPTITAVPPTATATPVPTATATPPPTSTPTPFPTPLSEWAWHELGRTPVRFQLPDNWQQIWPGYANHDWRRYLSAETGSILGVRNHAIRGVQDGLTWLSQNQQLQSAVGVTPDTVTQNALVQGHPAFWTASEVFYWLGNGIPKLIP